MVDFQAQRHRMVDDQLASRGIYDPRVIAAMRKVPREDFVDRSLHDSAYDDRALPTEDGQTISQPLIVAMMIEAAEISPDDHVLEVGAGSGYAAAVAGELAKHVYAIERHPGLAQKAVERLARLDYANISIRIGDGKLGWPDASPFEAILVSAGAPNVPPPLRDQLAVGGRLIIPIGDEERVQRLLRIRRLTQHEYVEENLGRVRFVPLIGEHASTKAHLS